jgi:hypothetical protein
MLAYAEPRGGELVPPPAVTSVRAEQAPGLLVGWLEREDRGSGGDGGAQQLLQQVMGRLRARTPDALRIVTAACSPASSPVGSPRGSPASSGAATPALLANLAGALGNLVALRARAPSPGAVAASQAATPAASLAATPAASPASSSPATSPRQAWGRSPPATPPAAARRSRSRSASEGSASVAEVAGTPVAAGAGAPACSTREPEASEGESGAGCGVAPAPAPRCPRATRHAGHGPSRFASEAHAPRPEARRARGSSGGLGQGMACRGREETQGLPSHAEGGAVLAPQGSTDLLGLLAEAAAAEAAEEAEVAADAAGKAAAAAAAGGGARTLCAAVSASASDDAARSADAGRARQRGRAAEPSRQQQRGAPKTPPRRRPRLDEDEEDEDWAPSSHRARRVTPDAGGSSPLRPAPSHAPRPGGPGGARTPPRRGAGGALGALPGSPTGAGDAWHEGGRVLTRGPQVMLPGGPCSACGAVSAPQWRRHPCTHADLCNACGIRAGRAHHKARPAVRGGRRGASRAAVDEPRDV